MTEKREISADELTYIFQLAAARPDLRTLAADLEELDRRRAEASSAPAADGTPSWSPSLVVMPQKVQPPVGAPVQPQNVQDLMALHQAGHIDRDELRDLLGIGPPNPDLLNPPPGHELERTCWGITWRLAGLGILPMAWLGIPDSTIRGAATLVAAGLAALGAKWLWRRVGTLGGAWRVLAAVSMITGGLELSFIPLPIIAAIAAGAALILIVEPLATIILEESS